jgi:hypothetical protein
VSVVPERQLERSRRSQKDDIKIYLNLLAPEFVI